MTAGGSKSYKRRRSSSGVVPKGAGAGGTAASVGAAAGGRSSPSPPLRGPYEGLTAEEALAKIASDADTLVPDQLYRLCGGLPRTELELMCAEAAECERALMEEIRILEEEMERLGTEEGTVAAKKGAEGGVGGKDGEGAEKKKEGREDAGEKIGGSQPEARKQEADAVGAAAKKANSCAGSSTAASATKQPPVDPSLPEVKPAIGDSSHFSTVNEMLASELTPPDRYFTVSALLGRLREPLDTPLPPNSALKPLRESQRAAQYRKGLKKAASDAEKKEAERRFRERLMERQRALLALESNPVYTRKLADVAPLLACWKRITNHRSAAVFRKAVNPREAPGYVDRILFPIDLALIRKMISAGHISSFQDLHRRIGLICHNCVKYNGRESDYGLVTREFESYADDSVIDAVAKVADAEAAAMAKAAAAKAAADAAAKATSVTTAAAAQTTGEAMPPPPAQKVLRTASSSPGTTPPPIAAAGGARATALAAAGAAASTAPPMASSSPTPPPTRPAGAPVTLALAATGSNKKFVGVGVAKPASAPLASAAAAPEVKTEGAVAVATNAKTASEATAP